MEHTPLSPEQVDLAEQIAASANERLDSYSLGNASRALNLSCSLMALPGLLIVLAVFLLSRFNWVMAAIAMTLLAITAFLLANLASSQARNRSMEKYYAREIHAEINKKMTAAGIHESQFNQIANEFLPINAPLKKMIEKNASLAGKDEP